MRPSTRRIVAAVAAIGAIAIAACGQLPANRLVSAAHRPGFQLRDIKHVFVIVLENEDFSNTFGSGSGYLGKALQRKGLLLTNYYATGHESNDNYISMISGQAPNVETQADCQLFVDFAVSATVPGEPHQQLGPGCVYPTAIANIGRQLSAHGLSWKAYMEDMGNVPSREAAACGHPTLGARDRTQLAVAGDGYAARHNPFVYFHDIIDNRQYCDRHVVALGSPAGKLPKAALPGETGLAHDLRRVRTTPHYAFITPNLCNDGHDYPCKNQPSGASGTADIDRFLKVWAPKIMSSPAFRANGLLEITFDESDGPQSDSSACCGEALDPNAVAGQPGLTGRGGGRIGALLLSPFTRPGSRSALPYNHYSTLATDEQIFGLPRLGYAQQARSFALKLFRLR